jgi:hypothetical protein
VTQHSCGHPALDEPTGSFYLFRCRAGCFHLVWRDAMVMHFTPLQLRQAVEALDGLWHGPPVPRPPTRRDNLFRAYRCSSGHCHLVCHGLVNLRLPENTARSLREEMLSAKQALNSGEPLCLAVDCVM